MTGPITIAQFVLMAALAVLVLIAIGWGVTLRRRRAEAARDRADDRAAAGRDMPAPVPAPVPPPLVTRAAAPASAAAPPPGAPDAPPPDAAPRTPAPGAATGAPTDLTRLKGLGPKLATTLGELGVTRIDQIAALTPAEAEALDARLGSFRGRMARDRWIDQARLLAAGDTAGYEAEFGRLGG